MHVMARLDERTRRSLWLEAFERSYARELITGIVTATRHMGTPQRVHRRCRFSPASMTRGIVPPLHRSRDARRDLRHPGFFGLAVTYRRTTAGADEFVPSRRPSQEAKEVAHLTT